MVAAMVRTGTGRGPTPVEGIDAERTHTAPVRRATTLASEMGQPIVVFQRSTSSKDVLRFEINRSLTGTGHERYRSAKEAGGDRPPDVLARRLFQLGGVRSVHIYSNVIDVTVDAGAKAESIAEVIRSLYIHYREGVTPSVA